jgi:transmembrane sensor
MEFENEFAALKMTDVLIRSINNELNEDEDAELQKWLAESTANKDLYKEMSEQASRSLALSGMERYPVQSAFSRIQKSTKRKSTRLWSRTIAAAAAILLVLGSVILIYNRYNHKINSDHLLYARQDIAPGKNVATLTMANGKVINLSDHKKGIVIDAAQLTYNDGTTIDAAADGKTDQYQSISTPRGGTYQVRLSDGTMVWLNAASTLRFPIKFLGNERKVEIIGEAYFEVTKNKTKPFKVRTDRQEIKVLGTHFNINSYANDGITMTTLLEGAVQVSTLNKTNKQALVLKPGQQSILTPDHFTMKQVDTEVVVAWKNGYFRFDDENLENIMHNVARWYNADVVFTNERLKKELFAGIISRDTKVSELLKMLELAGEVKFKIENNKIIVMDK